MPSRSAAELQMVLRHVSERSVLEPERAAGFQARYVDGRPRLATCSSVAWFNGYHLAVVNLFGGTLRVYRFHSGASSRLQMLHEIEVPHPESVAVSPNGRLMAIAHAGIGGGGLSLLPFDQRGRAPSAAQGETIRQAAAGTQFHGVSFSRDSRHLAFTEIGVPGYVEVVRLEGAAPVTTCVVRNHRPDVTAKSVAFSPDGRFAALALAPTSQARAQGGQPSGVLAVHRYDAGRGVIADAPTVELTVGGAELRNLETCAFVPSVGGMARILATNQGEDMVSAFAFDPVSGMLRFEGVVAGNLSFPHGVDVSADGRFVAITTYGDDSLHIARLAPAGVLSRGRQAIARALAALTS